jgi:SpoVK/Ycf46/Vps4 family AAA+-type ATPase
MLVPQRRRVAQEHAHDVTETQNDEKDAVTVKPFLNLFLTNIVNSFTSVSSVTEYLVGNMLGSEVKALNKVCLGFVQRDEEFPSILAESIDHATDPNDAVREGFLACVREEAKNSVFPNFGELVDLLINSYLSREETKNLLKSITDRCFPTFTLATREQPRLNRLAKLFGLSPKEIDIIMYYYCIQHDDPFETLCSFRRTVKEYNRIAAVIGLTVPELHELLLPRGNLRRQSILTLVEGFHDINTIQLDSGIGDYITGLSSMPFNAKIERLPTARFPINSFGLKEECLNIMLDLIRQNVMKHILIYGKPGVGKTEFVKSLVASSGRTAYSLKIGDANQARSERLVALSAAVRATRAEKSILIVDECDHLLCTEGHSFLKNDRQDSGKEWLNFFMDSAKVPMIWITNSIECIHPSVKRRFAFAEHFTTLSIENRLSMWANLCFEHGMSGIGYDPSSIELVRRFLPSPAEMESALRVLEDMSPDQWVIRLETVLVAKLALVTGHTEPLKPLSAITDSYEKKALNCDTPLEMVIKSVSVALKNEKPLALLFHGAPGTGKTELVKHIARTCERELYVRRASDILSPYVGVAEQNIAKVFRMAEQAHQILLLDEADSFFQDRKRARNTWEISLVNELLTQMENYRGVVFACTNLIDKLDTATLRRFAWKVKFSPPNESQRQLLFIRWFPSLPLDEATAEMLKVAEGVCPGDFKAVHSRLWLQEDDAKEEGRIQAKDIIAELIRETSYRNDAGYSGNQIGFKME